MIESRVFKAGSSTFVNLLLTQYAQGWIFGGIFLFIVSLTLSAFIDYRIIICYFIIVCLVVPTLMMNLYYNYGTKGENYVNVIDHRIEVWDDAVVLFLRIKKGIEEDIEGEDLDSTEEQKSESEEEEWRRYDYPFKAFGKFTVGKDYVTFPFLAPRMGFLYLPASAFDDEDFSKAVKKIAAGIRVNHNHELNKEN